MIHGCITMTDLMKNYKVIKRRVIHILESSNQPIEITEN